MSETGQTHRIASASRDGGMQYMDVPTIARFDVYAVHRSTGKGKDRPYVVDHLPTGARAFEYPDRQRAVELAAYLAEQAPGEGSDVGWGEPPRRASLRAIKAAHERFEAGARASTAPPEAKAKRRKERPMSEGTPRKAFKIAVIGADEDVPRSLQAYVRLPGRGGEFFLCWNRGQEPEMRTGLVARGEAPRIARGAAPYKPTEEIDRNALVAEFKEAARAGSKIAAGPMTLRGSWSATLSFDDRGEPTVELVRKLTTYGRMVVRSFHGGWKPSFDRDERWFGKARDKAYGPEQSLSRAITEAMGIATGLVAEACTYRDTTRRADVDTAYAEKHPPRHRADPQPPLERAREGKPKRERKPAAATTAPRDETVTKPAADSNPFEEAMKHVRPGDWKALTELYAPPSDAALQRKLGAWLDKYAKNGEDATILLDGRDNAGEAGIRGDALDEIARRLHYEPVAPKSSRRARATPAAGEGTAPAKPKRERRAALTQEEKDAAMMAMIKQSLAEGLAS